MPTSWVVATHGASHGTPKYEYSKMHQLVHIPPGVRMYFFDPEDAIMSMDKGWRAYNLVMKSGHTSQDYIAISKLPGYKKYEGVAVPDYAMTGDDSWIDNHRQLGSGIFIFGDELHKDRRTKYMHSGEWYRLSQFFNDRQWKPGDQVYWLACRKWF
jgi:hypothetical protein